MLRNYIISALRNLQRNTVFSAINLAGLSIGVACFALIALYVYQELSFDRFHENADRIYRVVADLRTENEILRQATTSPPIGPALEKEFPEVEAYTRLADRKVIVTLGEKSFYEEKFGWADANVFDVLSFPMVNGDPRTALKEPNTMVLTESAAKKYFGNKDPINEMLKVGRRELKVTGVIRDLPHNSHIQFTMLGSLSIFFTEVPELEDNWYMNGFYTYVLLKEGEENRDRLQAKVPGLIERNASEVASGNRMFFSDLPLQPITKVYLDTPRLFENGPRGSSGNIVILSVVALFILGIACFNYVNLATARASRRFKEVGLRKVLGAQRGSLVKQFLGESLITSLLATALGAALAGLLMPFFSSLVESPVSFGLLPVAWLSGVFVTIVLVVGFFSGLYPALLISALNPLIIFRGSSGTALGRNGVRKLLVAGQFAISIILFAATILVFEQLEFITSKDLGFTRESTVILPFNANIAVQKQAQSIKNELQKVQGVASVTVSLHVPGEPTQVSYSEIEMVDGRMSRTNINVNGIDADFIPSYGIELVAGRNFAPGNATYDTLSALVNETAVRDFGYTSAADIIGRKIFDQYPRTIIGVVKDFHYRSLHSRVEPLLIVSHEGAMSKFSVKVSGDIPTMVKALEGKWKVLTPGLPFRYSFLDEDYGRLYKNDQKLCQVVSIFSGLAIFVACLGLIGLISFAVDRKFREIGIRKVLGATVTNIILLLSKEFVVLILLALLVAIPSTYFIVNIWLTRFAEHITIGWWAFAVAGAAVLSIAWLSVSSMSWKAAVSNPVDALREEWIFPCRRNSRSRKDAKAAK